MANDLIKYGLIAAGGYLALKYFGVLDNLPGIGVGGPGQPVNTGGPTTASPSGQTPTNTGASENATISAMRSYMNANKLGSIDTLLTSVDTWNWIYSNVRGISNAPSPESLFPGVDRNRTYTFAEYWTAMTKAGFSGMGMIARVNPYRNPMGGRFSFGDNIAPSGVEMYVKRFT